MIRIQSLWHASRQFAPLPKLELRQLFGHRCAVQMRRPSEGGCLSELQAEGRVEVLFFEGQTDLGISRAGKQIEHQQGREQAER